MYIVGASALGEISYIVSVEKPSTETYVSSKMPKPGLKNKRLSMKVSRLSTKC
jgi:hypothetical protein